MGKVEDNQENFDICMEFCKTCPTFSKKEGEGLFCARGKSSESLEKKGCNCDACFVQMNYEKKSSYYCEHGVE
ncbi:MAG: DUF2769 domain-containing protein [Candidatus Hodarchaeales archaeon]|jgi:hypothetical protein